MNAVSNEGDDGPGKPADDDADAHVHHQAPHASHRRRVMTRVVFREERVAVGVVPRGQRPVEFAAAQSEVEEFYQRMDKEEHRDRVGCQVIDVVGLLHEVDEDQGELYYHEARYRACIPSSDGRPAEAHVFMIVQQEEAGHLHDPDQRPHVRDQTVKSELIHLKTNSPTI